MTISELKEQLRQRDLQLEKQAAQLERQAARIKKQAAQIKELERKIDQLKNLLVEVKASDTIHPIHKAQLLSYMKLLDIPLPFPPIDGGSSTSTNSN